MPLSIRCFYLVFMFCLFSYSYRIFSYLKYLPRKSFRVFQWIRCSRLKRFRTLYCFQPSKILLAAAVARFQLVHSLPSYISKGSDNRKIFDVHKSADGSLYAVTLFGLFAYNADLKQWQQFDLDSQNERFTGVESIGDTLYAITRSAFVQGTICRSSNTICKDRTWDWI